MPLLRRALLIAGASCAGWALFAPGPALFPYAWGALLAAGLGAYLLLPRTRRGTEFITYRRGASTALDILGALLFGAFFGLPWLITGGGLFDAGSTGLTCAAWAIAGLCLLIHRRAYVWETRAFRIVEGGVEWWRNSTAQTILSKDILHHRRTDKPGAALQCLQVLGAIARLVGSSDGGREKMRGTDRLEVEMRDGRNLTLMVQELLEGDVLQLEHAIAGKPAQLGAPDRGSSHPVA